jgi:hypothetical protein
MRDLPCAYVLVATTGWVFEGPADGGGAERTIAVYTSVYKYLTTAASRAYVAWTSVRALRGPAGPVC